MGLWTSHGTSALPTVAPRLSLPVTPRAEVSGVCKEVGEWRPWQAATSRKWQGSLPRVHSPEKEKTPHILGFGDPSQTLCSTEEEHLNPKLTH